jgi:hypothetical protein
MPVVDQRDGLYTPGMSGGLGALSMAWVQAEAKMPLGWRLMALVRQRDSG